MTIPGCPFPFPSPPFFEPESASTTARVAGVLEYTHVKCSGRSSRPSLSRSLLRQHWRAADFRGARQGKGGEIQLFGTIKPTDHLAFDFNYDRQWLDLDEPGQKGRLFTAQIQRLKATYNFNARSFVRLIGEYFDQDSNPALYAPIPTREHVGDFTGSAPIASTGRRSSSSATATTARRTPSATSSRSTAPCS